MPANRALAELPLLEALAAAPAGGIAEGHVEAAALALYAQGALGAPGQLEVAFDDGLPRCDQLIEALFSAYGQGLVEREGATWRLSARGRLALERVGLEPTAE